MTQFLNSPITAEEIKKAIQKLKCKKEAVVDGISAEFYRYGCNELLPALELLFNTIQYHSYEWRISIRMGYRYTTLQSQKAVYCLLAYPVYKKGGP